MDHVVPVAAMPWNSFSNLRFEGERGYCQSDAWLVSVWGGFHPGMWLWVKTNCTILG